MNCLNKFEADPKSETTEEVEVVFLECDTCGYRYFSYVKDAEVEKGIAKAAKLKRQLRTASAKKRLSVYRRLQKQTKRNRELMLQKKEEYSDIINQVIENS